MSLKLIRIQRLKAFAQSRGLSGPVQIGLVIGKSTSQTSDLLTGKAAFGEKVARSIEKSASLSVSWLDVLGEDADTAVGSVLRRQVPLLTETQIVTFKKIVNNFDSIESNREQITTSVPIKRHTFALRVMGDSMIPRFSPGMVLIIEPEMEAQPNDYVIAMNHSQDCTFKQLIKDGSDWYLKPLNDRYPIKALAGSSIIGVVRAVEERFR